MYGRVVRLLALLFLCFSTCLARPAYDLEPGTREMHGHIIYNVVSYLALLFIAVMFGKFDLGFIILSLYEVSPTLAETSLDLS